MAVYLPAEYAHTNRGSICPPEEVGLKIPVFWNAVLHTSVSGSQCSEGMCHVNLQKHGEQLT